MAFQVPSYQLTDKVAIITGSTRGIGKAIAQTMASYGAKVVISGRSLDSCKQIADAICSNGGDAIGIAAEITSASDRENLLAKTVEHYGRVDILVNNAGLGGDSKKFLDTDEAFFDTYIDIDFKSLYFMSQIVASQMKLQGCEPGTHPYRIINLASAAGILAPVGDSVYGTLKAAVIHVTRIMAKELARYGITCNAVAPGYVVTDMTKNLIANEKNAEAVKKMTYLRRYADPSEIAAVVNFIASPASSYIDGAVIPIDGGMSSK